MLFVEVVFSGTAFWTASIHCSFEYLLLLFLLLNILTCSLKFKNFSLASFFASNYFFQDKWWDGGHPVLIQKPLIWKFLEDESDVALKIFLTD